MSGPSPSSASLPAPAWWRPAHGRHSSNFGACPTAGAWRHCAGTPNASRGSRGTPKRARRSHPPPPTSYPPRATPPPSCGLSRAASRSVSSVDTAAASPAPPSIRRDASSGRPRSTPPVSTHASVSQSPPLTLAPCPRPLPSPSLLPLALAFSLAPPCFPVLTGALSMYPHHCDARRALVGRGDVH